MKLILVVTLIAFYSSIFSQEKPLTKTDTLMGSDNSHRTWWNVLHYDITFQPDFKTKTIVGNTVITYQVIKDSLPFVMQIDLSNNLRIDSIKINEILHTNYVNENNYILIKLETQKVEKQYKIKLFYHGKPKVALNAPWDGGLIWTKDSLGNPWMSIACQNTGASIWFPCKNLQGDEPDSGATLNIIVPDTLVGVGNGKLISTQKLQNNLVMHSWQVLSTINSYDIIPYIGKYKVINDSVIGERGVLKTDYWVLNYHFASAMNHLKPNVIKTLKCLEYWYGAFPFYKDSYKIVEAPYLGMEHQSNIAYGNKYQNGYLGKDLSNSAWGLKWDFIVVHETAHEWFGNSVTAYDVADNWIHEALASYAEVLFTECEFGKEAGNDYCEGVKKSILNDIPMIGKYNVKKEGSPDIYNKGSQVIHMIRQLMDNDENFRILLRDISETFYHKIITSNDLELFISSKSGLNLSPFFNQYLRTTQIPVLEYKVKGKKLHYRYTNCNSDFVMPIKIKTDVELVIKPTTKWQILTLTKTVKKITINRNVYLKLFKIPFI